MSYFGKRRDSDASDPVTPSVSAPRKLSTPIPSSLTHYDYADYYLSPSSAPKRGTHSGPPSARDIALNLGLSISITPDELANFLEIDPRIIQSLCDVKSFKSNYCCKGRGKPARLEIGMEGVRRILRDLHELTKRPVDRVSLLLWMVGTRIMGDDAHRESRDCKPFYDAKVEGEIERIAKLEQPARTMMAIELLERYRDAEVIAGDVVEAQAAAKTSEVQPDPIPTVIEPPIDKVNRLRRVREWAAKLSTPEMIRAQKLLDKPQTGTRKEKFKRKLEKMAEGR